MKSLYLAWQAPKNSKRSSAWFPIGRLDAELEGTDLLSCRFRYIEGANKAAAEVGFEPLISFPDFKCDYRSEKLFPIFHNRVISSKREDFPEYIDWLDLSASDADPISILSVSGGQRVTDNLHTFPKLQADPDGHFHLRFFAHGLSHLPPSSKERVNSLKAGEKLRIMVEVNNPATKLAVTLHSEDYTMLGWAPRYLVEDLVKCIPHTPEIEATVVKVNGNEAPLNQRLLVSYSGKAPQEHSLMSSIDFTPLIGS